MRAKTLLMVSLLILAIPLSIFSDLGGVPAGLDTSSERTPSKTQLDALRNIRLTNHLNDSDGDGIMNANDSCPTGVSNWTSTNVTDHDGDGCHDDLWLRAQHVEGYGQIYGYDIAVDQDGNEFVTGTFTGATTFEDGIWIDNQGSWNTSRGVWPYVAKRSVHGEWQWSTIPEYCNGCYSVEIAVAASGEVYIAGMTSHNQWNATFGTSSFQPQYIGEDLFVSKLDRNGSWLWTVFVEGEHKTYVRNLELDSSGNPILVGEFYSRNITIGSETLTNANSSYNGAYQHSDIFIAKLSSDGVWQWATSAGGGSNDFGMGLSSDAQNNLYLTGFFHSESISFGSDTLQNPYYLDDYNSSYATAWGGGLNATPFVAKLDSSGNWKWATAATSTGILTAIETDDQGVSFVTGDTTGQISTDGTWLWSIDFDQSGISQQWPPLLFSYGIDIALGPDSKPYVLTLEKNSSYNFQRVFRFTTLGELDWESGFHISKNQNGFYALYSVDVDDRGIAHTSGLFSGDWIKFEDVELQRTLGSQSQNSLLLVQFSSEDLDDDNDGRADWIDNCSTGILNWSSNPSNDYDTDGCHDGSEDTDDDNDGRLDGNDAFPFDAAEWLDNDGDGLGDNADLDDDNDGWSDTMEWLCITDYRDVQSYPTDTDGDGICNYLDTDDDNDAVNDTSDDCPQGTLDWTSNSTSDWDSDGCRDWGEDSDDDNDDVIDSLDLCPETQPGKSIEPDGCAAHQKDTDSDGVNDEMDQCSVTPAGVLVDSIGCPLDSDDDGVPDHLDAFPENANETVDSDGDGVGDNSDAFPLDRFETLDSDSDGIGNNFDNCPFGHHYWNPTAANDRDGDGCFDIGEDIDDDGDLVNDTVDACPEGTLYWLSSKSTDNDFDGCRDSDEDDDDDDDGLRDDIDECPRGDTGWIARSSTDHDSDGCQDDGEDTDDDNDGVPDGLDSCPRGNLGWTSIKSVDWDSDGCADATEDVDDDNDGVLDAIEIEGGTDPLDPNSKPAQTLSIVIGAVELSVWDLMGIIIGLLTSGFLAFAFITRGGRYERFSEEIVQATDMTIPSLEKRLEISSFVRLISPRQSIKLESLLDERKYALGAGRVMFETDPDAEGMATVTTGQPPAPSELGIPDNEGYEWLDAEGANWYRVTGSGGEWTRWD